MSATKTIWEYRNDKTGELAPPHRIGSNEEGKPIYQSIDGWTPVDSDGNEIECEYDYDGNWIVV